MKGRVKLAAVAAACLATLVPLRYADAWLSQGSKPRMAYLQLLDGRLKAKPKARIALMGQSTIGKWLVDGDRFARMYELSPKDVVGAQIGGCDYTCSYAEAKNLLHRGKHFEQIYYGANLYQMCEDPRSWRVFTPLVLIPEQDLFGLLSLWGHARQPLSYYGRALGMQLSSAYDDSISSRKHLARELGMLEERRGGTQGRWAREIKRPKSWSPSCDYQPDDIALKTEAVKRLLRDLARLSDHVYWMAFPDRMRGEPKYRDVWRKFVAHHRAMAEAVPNVTFVDLATEGAAKRSEYTDGAHLSPAGMKTQSALLQKKLAELGVKP
jgi:hypothetical protein